VALLNGSKRKRNKHWVCFRKNRNDETKNETMAGTAAGWRVIIGPLLVSLVFLSSGVITTVEGRLGDVVQPQQLQQDDQPQKHRQLQQVTRHTSNATTTADNVFARAPLPASDGATDNDDNDANSTTSRGTGSAVVVDNVKQQQQGSSLSCLLNDKGLFGDANAARNSGAQAFELQYLYQLYLAPGTTTTTLLNSEVALDVDRAIVTAILPNFFDCRDETSTRRRRLLLLRHNRALQDSGGATIESISALPIDLLVQPRNCKLPR
jgi:hypothetical protein